MVKHRGAQKRSSSNLQVWSFDYHDYHTIPVKTFFLRHVNKEYPLKMPHERTWGYHSPSVPTSLSLSSSPQPCKLKCFGTAMSSSASHLSGWTPHSRWSDFVSPPGIGIKHCRAAPTARCAVLIGYLVTVSMARRSAWCSCWAFEVGSLVPFPPLMSTWFAPGQMATFPAWKQEWCP